MEFESSLPRKNLGIGEVIVTTEPVIIWTPLGSCVSVVLHDPVKRITAMTHSQLPEKRDGIKKCSDSCPNPCHLVNEDIQSDMKYLSCGFRYIFDSMVKYSKLRDIRAYIVGGANIGQTKIEYLQIGKLNYQTAEKMIKQLKLNKYFADIGGFVGRTFYFNTSDGTYVIKKHT